MPTLVSNSAINSIVKTNHRTLREYRGTMERLSSGSRINRSADDAAIGAVAENLRAEALAYRAAERNALQGVAVTQIADGASGDVHDILSRIRELAVSASSEVLHDDERAYVDAEHQELIGEIDRIAENTVYSGTVLMNGSVASLGVQVGTGNSGASRIDIALGDVRTATLGIDSLDLSTVAGARAAIDLVDDAIQTNLGHRGSYGASANRLEHAASFLSKQSVAMAASASRLSDADLAKEASDMARLQMQMAAGAAALGQAKNIDRTATAGLLTVFR